jgi:hypothetical protein
MGSHRRSHGACDLWSFTHMLLCVGSQLDTPLSPSTSHTPSPSPPPRWGHKPDGVCLVVGGCARGFDPVTNTTADIIYTNTDMAPPGAAAAAAAARGRAPSAVTPSSSSSSKASARAKQLQYFWEAFPAADGLIGGGSSSSSAHSRSAGAWKSDARTTYMFTYMDAQVGCVGIDDVCALGGGTAYTHRCRGDTQTHMMHIRTFHIVPWVCMHTLTVCCASQRLMSCRVASTPNDPPLCPSDLLIPFPPL